MNKKSGIVCVLLTGWIAAAAHAETTLAVLVNFTGYSKNRAVVSAEDYQVADSWVPLEATVNYVAGASTTKDLVGTGLANITCTTTQSGAWDTDKGLYVNKPIVNSYLFDTEGGLSKQIAISGLYEIPVWQTVLVTVWGVGDEENADTEFTLTYNGTTSETKTTDYDNGVLFQQFTFVKVPGVNSLTVNWGKTADGATAGFGGLSITTRPGPITVGLLPISRQM